MTARVAAVATANCVPATSYPLPGPCVDGPSPRLPPEPPVPAPSSPDVVCADQGDGAGLGSLVPLFLGEADLRAPENYLSR